jgi:hypothetical protein
MPGPVSDSYDPEWGTGANRGEIEEALKDVYDGVSVTLGNKPPIYILDLVRDESKERRVMISRALPEKEWRLIRFALERAPESL